MFKTKKGKSDSVAVQAAGDDRVYSSADVSRLSGVSLRQLQWWDERKVVSPRHEGHRRLYLGPDVIEVAIIAELRRKGFSLQKIRRVLRFMQKEMDKRQAEILSPDGDLHLLTDGKNIYLEHSRDRVIDLLKGARQAMFVVGVSDQIRRIEAGQAPPARKPAGKETSPQRRAKQA